MWLSGTVAGSVVQEQAYHKVVGVHDDVDDAVDGCREHSIAPCHVTGPDPPDRELQDAHARAERSQAYCKTLPLTRRLRDVRKGSRKVPRNVQVCGSRAG